MKLAIIWILGPEVALPFYFSKMILLSRAVGSFFMVGWRGGGKNVRYHGWPTTKNFKIKPGETL